MSEADMTPDQTAAETPSVEDQTQTELQSEQEQVGQTEDVAQDDDSEDLEYEGTKYRIPKQLKSGFMMQADYTRKTQEVAEQRKAVESEREAFTKSVEAQKEHIADVGRLRVFDDTLEQYAKVDWQNLRATDPDRANAAFQDYMQLRTQRDQLAQKVDGEVQKRTQAEQQDFAKRYEEATSELVRDIPGWTQETASKVRDFAFANGVKQDELRIIATNAKLSKLLHKAWLGDQLIQKQQAAAKAASASKAQTEPKPIQTIGRRPSTPARQGLHDDLSIDEWMKRANAQR